MERCEQLKISLGLAAALCLLAAAPARAGGIIVFDWEPQTNDNWGQSSNWNQYPGAGDIPDASNHRVTFFGDAGQGHVVDLQGNNREVESMQVNDNNQYHFRDGTLGNWGHILIEKQTVKFGPTLTYQQLDAGIWLVQEEGGVLMDAVMEGSGTIDVRGNPSVTEVNVRLNAANPYDGIYIMRIGTTTLGHALALQNARVELGYDNPLDFNGFNPTFGGLSGANALNLGSTVLTLDGHISELSTYSGALTSDGSGQIICATADRFPQAFTGSISNLGVFRVDSGLARLASGTFQFVSTFPSGAIDINGGELSIEDSAEVTLTSSNANGGTVNISGGKLSIGDAELYAGRLTSVSNGEVALSNTNLAAPGLIIGKNGSLNVTSTFAGKFTGTGSFKKVGTGALTLTGASTLTGEAIIDEGTIVLGTATTLQNTVVRQNLVGGLNINGFEPHIGGLSGSVALDMGAVQYTIGSDGSNATYSGVLSANSSNLLVPCLIKTGSNVQELTGTSSPTGSFLVEGGTLRIAGGGHFSPLGSHKVAVAGRLDVVEGSTLTPNQILSVGGLVYVEGATVDATSLFLEESTNAGFEALGGSTVTASLISVGRLDGNVAYLSAIGQGTSISATRLDLGPLSGNGFGLVSFDDSANGSFSDWVRLSTNQSVLSINGASLSTNRLISVGTTAGTIGISDPATGSALTVGTQNGSSTFGGLVKDWISGPGSITKIGTGSFTLSHANTYTGGTIVNGGKLVLANSTGSATGTGGVSVQNGGTLAGNGLADGTSTIASGGTVTPGTSIGAMTLQNAAFQAGSTLEIEFAMQQHDELIVSGTATLAGTLKIVNLNGLPAVGNSYVVLSAGTLAGEFDTLSAPSGTNWLVQYDYEMGTVTVGPCEDADGDDVCNEIDACPGFDDSMDIDSDGVPDACDTDCSGFPAHVSTAQELIDALNCANAQPDANTIYLDADITLTAVDHNSLGATGLPTVTTTITLEGQGHTIERESNAIDPFRLFQLEGNGNLTLNEMMLRNGTVDPSANSVNRRGGAVFALGGNVKITNCAITENKGGAICLIGSSAVATLDSVTLSANSGNTGGAINAIYGGTLTLRNSVVVGNSGNNLGTIAMEDVDCQTVIANTIISGGGGVYSNGSLSLVNCTIAGNKSGLTTAADGVTTVVNSLIWGNSPSTGAQINTVGVLTISHTGIEGGVAGIVGSGTINDLGGNLNFSGSDSVFVNPIDPASAPTTAGDYHLAPDSVAIDQGSNTESANAGLTTDFEGDNRIIGLTVDMGADEAACSLDGDDDGDGVCNSADICPTGDDNADADSDGVPDGCDACPGFDDTTDADNDSVPDGCDVCPGGDDTVDDNNNGIPDACDTACPGGALGDVNTDGTVDPGDVPTFVAVLLDPDSASANERCAADVNVDGLVDGNDAQDFVDQLLIP